MEIVLLLCPHPAPSSIISLTRRIVLTRPWRGVLLSDTIWFHLTQAGGIRQVERKRRQGELAGTLLFTFVLQRSFVAMRARVSIIAEIFTLDYISNKRQWR